MRIVGLGVYRLVACARGIMTCMLPLEPLFEVVRPKMQKRGNGLTEVAFESGHKLIKPRAVPTHNAVVYSATAEGSVVIQVSPAIGPH